MACPCEFFAGREWRTRFADQIASDGPDVIGEVHVLREALNDAIGFRQGGATFEDKVGA
jgi:hypothetical protein